MSLSAQSFVFAVIIGVVIAAFRVSPVPPLRFVGRLYVEVIRNTPLLAQLFLAGFGLTKVGIQFSFYTTAVIVLSMYAGSFIAETVRSGILTVQKGQAEAARSIGLGFFATLRHVVLPQALRTVAAPIGSLFIANHKNTSLAQVLAVAEVTFVAEHLANEEAQSMLALLGAAICYVVVTYPAGLLVGVIERRVAIRR
jgi:glutamate transport system permease protein